MTVLKIFCTWLYPSIGEEGERSLRAAGKKLGAELVWGDPTHLVRTPTHPAQSLLRPLGTRNAALQEIPQGPQMSWLWGGG